MNSLFHELEGNDGEKVEPDWNETHDFPAATLQQPHSKVESSQSDSDVMHSVTDHENECQIELFESMEMEPEAELHPEPADRSSENRVGETDSLDVNQVQCPPY